MPALLTPPDAAQQQTKICAKTVMDTTDPDIRFDDQGVSNWWHDYQKLKAKLPSVDQQEEMLERTLNRIRSTNPSRKYNCVIGLSGGVDSSYVTLLAHRFQLRPLIVHFDNGWNNELAVSNIEKMVKTCGFKLATDVLNWPEFRDLQRAYFKASVVDLEVPTDHMIFASLNQIACREKIKFILSGNNLATEWLLPPAWFHPKADLRNLIEIHRQYGECPIGHLPKLGVWRDFYYKKIKGIETIEILNLVPYRKLEAKETLIREFGWRDYGGKHYESIFTRFYQGYILPNKFGIDKRKAHLSNLILNQELSRDRALEELKQPTYNPDVQEQDKRYVAKKLGWSLPEFERILTLPNRKQTDFGSDAADRRRVQQLTDWLHPFGKVLRRFTGV